MDTELQALTKLLVEFLVVIFFLCDLGKHFKALLYKVFLDHTENLVLLQSLTRDVQGQILGVDDTFNEVQPLWHEFIAIVHNEDSPHIQLNVIAFLFRFKEIERRPAWYEEKSAKLKLSFHTKVLHGEMVLPIVGERLIKACVLLVGHILRLTHPKWFVFIELFPFVRNLLDLLGLFLFLFLLFLL